MKTGKIAPIRLIVTGMAFVMLTSLGASEHGSTVSEKSIKEAQSKAAEDANSSLPKKVDEAVQKMKDQH